MVKMSWAIDLEAQQISRLNEHFLVVDRIRKAGRCVCQGNGWLRNKLLNPSSGSASVPAPSTNSEGSAPTKRFVRPQVQNDRDIRSKTCIPSPERPPLKNPDHGNKMSAVLVVLGGLA
jgi:hypothetical protein